MTTTTENFETLALEHGDDLAIITLRRPERSNALGAQSGRDLRAVASICATDSGVRAVLLRSEGRNFCVGGDLAEFAASSDLGSAVRAMTVDFHAAIASFARMRAPLVMAVQGAAAGAGLSLVGIADLTVAGRSASFTAAYTGVGFSADGGMTWTLPRLIGLRRYQELVFTNRTVKADEAQTLGLVTEVVDDEQLATRSEALARQLAQGPTSAYGAVRRLVLESSQRALEPQLDQESLEISALAAGADAQAAIQAALQRQRPRFTGQ